MSYVIVGGSQRTGTSIAQQILCQLPSANPYLYEASYLTQLVRCYAEARNAFGPNHASYFGDVQNLRDFNAGVVHAFLDQVAARVGQVEHLILKEPHLTMWWPFLFELVPEASFLLMVRDPRDAIASMVRVGEKQKALGQDYLFAERNIARLCQHFLSFYEPVLTARSEQFHSQLCILHYEQLVTESQQTLQTVADFTGIPFHQIDSSATPDPGHVRSADTASHEMYSPWVTEVSGAKLSSRRVGNYTDVLSAVEVAQIEFECHSFCRRFGYTKVAA